MNFGLKETLSLPGSGGSLLEMNNVWAAHKLPRALGLWIISDPSGRDVILARTCAGIPLQMRCLETAAGE